MTPHPVYIPSGMVMRDRKSWQYRARAFLRSDGVRVSPGNSKIRQKVDEILEHPDGASTGAVPSPTSPRPTEVSPWFA
jgi:hypothetical protein